MVFLTIYQYFTDSANGLTRARTMHLFKAKGNMDDVDKLEKHVSLGNYKYLLAVEDPYTVATFFRSILKCMAEPLCKFAYYDKFKFLAKGLSQNHVQDPLAKKIFISDLQNIIEPMEQIYKNSWHFLVHFI